MTKKKITRHIGFVSPSHVCFLINQLSYILVKDGLRQINKTFEQKNLSCKII